MAAPEAPPRERERAAPWARARRVGARLLRAGPDLLTLSRVPLAAVPWAAPGDGRLLVGAMTAAAATDVADGWLARSLAACGRRPLRGPAEAGAWLDPVCDKLFVLSALVSVIVATAPPAWLPLALLTREVGLAFVLGGGLLSKRLRAGLSADLHAAAPGKATTVAQFLGVGALLVAPAAAPALAVLAGLLGAVAVGYYLRRALTRA